MLLSKIKELELLHDQERYKALKSWLWQEKIHIDIHQYKSGKNLIVPAKKQPRIGVSSHYDTVPNSPGANDNLSAVVVCLELAKRLRDNPTQHIGVDIYFFDQEERGLIGSRKYLMENSTESLFGLINMEMVGSGDQFALWPLDNGHQGSVLTAFEAVCRKQNISTRRIDRVVMNTADHESFRDQGIADNFTISVISNQDLEVAAQYYKAIATNEDYDTLRKIIDQAPIFEHYHKASDSSEHLTEKSLQMTADAIWQTIQNLDNVTSDQNEN